MRLRNSTTTCKYNGNIVFCVMLDFHLSIDFKLVFSQLIIRTNAIWDDSNYLALHNNGKDEERK